jgi:CHAT domain-containing protein
MIKNILIIILFCNTVVLAQNSKDEKFVTVYNTGVQSLEKQDIENAIQNLEEAYSYSIDLYGNSSIEMAQVCYYLATAYQDKKPQKAMDNILKAKPIFKKEFGELSQENATLLSVLGNIYLNLKEFDKAKETYFESQSLAKQFYGENSINYGVSCTNTAAVLLKVSDFNTALLYINEGLEILKNQAEFPKVYFNNLRYNNLPFIYEGLGRYDEALSIYEESLHYISKRFGSNSVNYAHILQSIGMVQLKLGLLAKAESAFLKSIDILTLSKDKEFDASLANAYMGLAVYYTQNYDYESAINYSNLAIKINETLETKALEYDAGYYEILSNLYYEMGNTSFAKDLLEKAKNKSKEVYGENALEYAVKLSNYAKLEWYFDKEESIKLVNQALTIAEEIDVNSPQYQECLVNFIPILIRDHKIEEAIMIAKKSVAKIDQSSSVYWEKNLLLAELYMLDTKYAQAETVLEETTKAMANIYGNKSPNYANALHKYIEALFNQEKYSNLTELIQECNPILIHQVKDFFKFASEKPKNTYLQKLEDKFDFFQSVGYALPNDGELAIINYENQLLLKGLLLNTSKDLITKLTELNDAEINKLITAFLQKKNEFVKNNTLQKKDEKGLNMEIINLENELTDLYNTYYKTEYNNQFEKSFHSVQDKLGTNEIAIEFSKIDISKYNEENPNFIYVAYLIAKVNKYPKLIILGKENDINTILKEAKINPNETYKTRGSSANKIGVKAGAKELYKLIWKPLESFVHTNDTVYIALSGILYQIPIVLLTNETNEMLLERYQLVHLNSTFDITINQTEPKLNNALFVGGIQYDYIVNNGSKSEGNRKNILGVSKLDRQSDKKKWDYLPATLIEINNIEVLFKKNNTTFQILSDTLATESKMKALDKVSPSVIHIATHGFFFENIVKNKAGSLKNENIFQFSDDPLLRSGLLFSGANYAWLNGNNPYDDEDGILTALEISNLDLHSTELVVLSACETGLGDVNGSEGVYGLQRAFKKAGVTKLIMSLWQVPDKETSEFMELLYTNWFNGMTCRNAFQKTQLSMALKYKDFPEKWAAFVLVN